MKIHNILYIHIYRYEMQLQNIMNPMYMKSLSSK